MKFQYRYFGHSKAQTQSGQTSLSFVPDASRSPVFMQAQVRQPLAFREAISALHDVVVSDLRPSAKDRTAYFAWLQDNETRLLADFMAQSNALNQQAKDLQTELNALRQEKARVLAPFYQAQKQYFHYLYQQNKEAWFVLDPVITVHPDKVFFECFSRDESTYASLSCSHEMLAHQGDYACGTTNIDYSEGLYQAFQKIRSYHTTQLTVEAGGFNVQVNDDPGFSEEKIDLPDSWVRGFLQVSSAMTLPVHTVQLQPMDIYNICHQLRRHKEQAGPRAIRFILTPGEPVQMVFEPWNHTITCARSIYQGSQAQEVRIWGRRRLLTLERLIAVAEHFTVHLLGYGLPSFWVAQLPGPMHYTLGLSGWTANDWARNAQFDLLAPRQHVEVVQLQQVLAVLQKRWFGSAELIAQESGMAPAVVLGALTLLTQEGRVIYDLASQVWRLRELTPNPVPLEALRFASEQESQAARVLAQAGAAGAKALKLQRSERADGGYELRAAIADAGQTFHTVVGLDADERQVSGQCLCHFFFSHHLRRGPCAHMLALRQAYAAQAVLGTAAVSAVKINRKNKEDLAQL